MRKPFNFTMGADPEFNLIMQNRRIQASETLSVLFKGDTELKRNVAAQGYDYLEHGNVGWDGANSIAEIRPSPSNTADKLVENIEKILTKLCQKTPIIDLSTLSYYASVGGHIHLGVPPEFSTSRKIGMIHKKLASFYLPLMLAENKINLQIRLKSGYGTLTDWRPQQYKANLNSEDFDGYEFRSPSAEWITTKKIALATLAYIGTIYNEIINNPNNIKKHSELFIQTAKQAEALQLLALSGYKSLMKSIFQKTKTAIKTFEFYPEYKQEIDYLFDPEKVLKDKATANYNIAEGWGIVPLKKQPTKKDLTNKKKIAKIASKADLDLMQSLINVSYNDDTNIQLFVKGLVERVAVYSWKLKNTYFLFGTRKGINDFIVFDNDSYNGSQTVYLGQDMVKTDSDRTALMTLMDRMIKKSNQQDQFNSLQSSDTFHINSIINDLNPHNISKKYFVGIPYETRIQHDINPFIQLIYDLENKDSKTFSPTVTWKGLPNDLDKPFGKRGNLYQILNRTSDHPDVVFAMNTNGEAQRRIVEAINELAPTTQQEEEEEEGLTEDFTLSV